MKDQPTTYQIYGRKAYETPLTLVSKVDIESGQALEQVVLAQVGADGWIELVVMPDEAMIYVTREEKA